MFSIIIPSFNNLNYLKLCIKSLKKNSKFAHEIIIHVNEGTDGTLDYVVSNNLMHTHTEKNVGLCTAVNLAAAKSTTEYIVFGHDDMYFCPGWDTALDSQINQLNTKAYFLSGTMIEKERGHIQIDCGNNYKDFDENKLLKKFNEEKYFNYQGSHWPPNLVHKSYWKKIGGFSEEFNPGVGCDPDLNMKLWINGVRLFKGLENCRVYHFSSVTLRKKTPNNNGAKTFLLKWGITIKFFKKYYLKTDTVFDGELKEPNKTFSYYINLLKCKCSFAYYFFLKKLKFY